MPPPPLAEKLRACLAEWFESVGMTDPPPVELHDTIAPQTGWNLTVGSLSVFIETRRNGIRDARTRAEIGYAINLDRRA